MSIVSVHELHDKNRIDHSTYPRTGRRVFGVRTTDPGTPYQAINASGIPVKYDAHNEDATLFCRGPVSGPESKDSREYFIVTCDYTASYISIVNDNPLVQPTIFDWGKMEFSEVFNRDLYGVPVANSAGQLFPGIERPLTCVTLTVTRNESTYSPDTAMSYANAVNSDAFTINGHSIGVGVALCKGITGRYSYQNGAYFYQKTYEFWFRPTRVVGGDTWSGWSQFLVDQGMAERRFNVNTNHWELRKILDKVNGGYVNEPVLLNGAGAEMTMPAPPDQPTPIELPFVRFPLVAFTPLGTASWT